MAIQSSGRISINDIVGEFGGTAPHSLSEYYRGGARVPNITLNNNIPTTGSISLSDFYGATSFQSLSVNVAALNTNTWWANVVNSDGDAMPIPRPNDTWQFALDQRLRTEVISIAPAVVRIPSFTVTIAGDKDSDDYDDDEYTGIRNPGVRIVNPNGTVLGTTRGIGEIFGRGSVNVTVPAAEFTATQTGRFNILFVANMYRSFEGDASFMGWTSPAFNVSWSTA
jgi:hypothetical protein